MSSNTIILVALAVAIAAVIAFVVYSHLREKRTRHLIDRFGPEYGRLAAETGSLTTAEKRLAEREKRIEKFKISELGAEDARRFLAQWQLIQAHFVDNPKVALANADELLGAVMAARGYPVTDFEQRAADLSADHPIVVQNYHAAHEIALRHRRGEASTEDLRQAMLHYRALFEELVSHPTHAHAAQ